eukprot:TRINITY_DN92855_c0_g1_i1.p1 TRINITY_DN92855_c0_g1~~TRINITY_DN92855_c0_g1_i1.p1  ORF type:complete len:401 (+),score=72.89 TRINITY_DN92855_c0_g1_i1:64-1266(+)
MAWRRHGGLLGCQAVTAMVVYFSAAHVFDDLSDAAEQVCDPSHTGQCDLMDGSVFLQIAAVSHLAGHSHEPVPLSLTNPVDKGATPQAAHSEAEAVVVAALSKALPQHEDRNSSGTARIQPPDKAETTPAQRTPGSHPPPLADVRQAALPVQVSAEPEAFPTAVDRSPSASPFWVVLRAALIVVNLFILSVVLYELANYWRHQVAFRSCQQKLQRAHKAFSAYGERVPVCPCCLDYLPDSLSADAKLVLHCGHSYHRSCVHRWQHKHGEGSLICPVCRTTELLNDKQKARAPLVPEEMEAEKAGAATTGSPSSFSSMCKGFGNDGLHFCLQQLLEQYPQIVTEAFHARWLDYHSETWLSELACPEYRPLVQWCAWRPVLCWFQRSKSNGACAPPAQAATV